MVMLKRLYQVAAKTEVTPGTAIALANTNCIGTAYNVDITPDISFDPVVLAGTLEQKAGVAGNQNATVKLSVPLQGAGTSGVPYYASTLFPACGMLNTDGTFSVTSVMSDWTYVTIAKYYGASVETVAGCQGTFKINLENSKYGTIDFEFRGTYQGNTDASALTGVATAAIEPPKCQGMTLTLGAYTPIVEKIMIDLGNTTVYRPSIASSTGTITGQITDRRITGSLDPERVTVATNDFIGQFLAGTEVALSIVVGTATDNTITIAAPKLQYNKTANADRNGIDIHNLDFQLNADTTGDNVSPYDNSFSIAYS